MVGIFVLRQSTWRRMTQRIYGQIEHAGRFFTISDESLEIHSVGIRGKREYATAESTVHCELHATHGHFNTGF